MDHPDTNAKAPRPAHMSSEDEPRPDMDHAPPAPSDTSTAFDRGTAAADQEARTGQRPGPEDFAATQAEGTADEPAVERAKHPAVPDDKDPQNEAAVEARRRWVKQINQKDKGE